MRVQVDRDRAAQAGVPMASVAGTLRAAVEGAEAGKLRLGGDEIPIRVRLGEADRGSASDMLAMTLWTAKGRIALGDVASVERGEGPNVIEREDRQRQIRIYAWPMGRSLGEMVPEFEAAFMKIETPPGAGYTFDGEVRNMRESNN